MTINFKKLDPRAVIPTKGTPGSAAYDLTAISISTEVNEIGQVVIVYHTGLALEIPEGYYGDIRPRSSIYKKSIRLVNSPCVIDSDFRGEITLKFTTTTDVIPAVYNAGDRIAQLIITKCEEVEFNETAELSETERGEGGYGSTDTKASAVTPLQQSESVVDTKDDVQSAETVVSASEQAADPESGSEVAQ